MAWDQLEIDEQTLSKRDEGFLRHSEAKSRGQGQLIGSRVALHLAPGSLFMDLDISSLLVDVAHKVRKTLVRRWDAYIAEEEVYTVGYVVVSDR